MKKIEENENLYNLLQGYNSLKSLQLAKEIVKLLKIKEKVPFCKTFHIADCKGIIRRSSFFGLIKKKDKVGLWDSYSLQIESDGKWLKITKIHVDLTDYGMSCMAMEAFDDENIVVNIKLKNL